MIVRDGTRLRHEWKSYINHHEYHILRNRLSRVLKNDPHANDKGEYFIRSLYFDDIRNTALVDKQSGIRDREKFRIRLYNHHQGLVRLERKEKRGHFIAKTSATLTWTDAAALAQGHPTDIHSESPAVLNQLNIAMRIRKMRPAVLVDYTREAWTCPTGNVRITFDKRLSTGLNSIDIFNKNVPTVPSIHPSTMIMEIKYDSFLPAHVRGLLGHSLHSFSAISKYVICRKYTKANDWEDQ